MSSGFRQIVVMVTIAGQLLLTVPVCAQVNDSGTVARVSVPLVVGNSAKDAMSAVKLAGLVPKFRVGKQPARPEEANTVYATDPAPGMRLAKGSVVQLTLYARAIADNATTTAATEQKAASTDRGGVVVPSIIGSSAKDATAAVKAIGLRPRFVLGSAPAAPTAALTVYAQQPKPGAMAALGDTVNITIHSREAASNASTVASGQDELTQVSALPFLDQTDEEIDPRSGRLFSSTLDVIVPAGAINLEVRRFLQSFPGGAGLLGTRWRLNWESRLFQSKNQVIVEADGQQVGFAWDDAAKRFTSASGDQLLREGDDAFCVKRRNGVKETFDSRGRLIEQDERHGNKVTLTYGADGKLARVAGPRGTWLQLHCDKKGRLIEIESSIGCAVRYKYSRNQETPADNDDEVSPTVRYTCNENGALQRIVHPRYGATEFLYDNSGRVVSRSWADGSREQFNFDDTTKSLRHTDRSGQVTFTHWSKDGRRQELMDALGRKTTTDFDDRGRLAQITGPTGQFVRLTYDALGRVESIVDTAGRATQYEYVGDSELIAARMVPDGPRHTFTYDDRMNLIESRIGTEVVLQRTYYPDGLVRTSRELGQAEQQFTYDAAGHLATISDSLNNQVQYEYDRRGNLTRIINPAGGETICSYDAHDHLLTQTDPSGQSTRYKYDKDGDLSSVIDPTSQVVQFEYDKLGRPLSVTDPSGKRTTHEYDAHGQRVKTITDGQEELYDYDSASNLIAIKNSSGANWVFVYDGAGQLVSESGPLGHYRSWLYDAAGRVLETQDALNRKTKYSYDDQGRLSAIRDPAGRAQRLEYSPDGRLLATVDTLKRRMAIEYDEYGHVIGLSRNAGTLLKTDYLNGRPSKVTGPDGNSVSNSYDTIGQLGGHRYANGESFGFKYNAFGQVVEAVDGLAHVWKMSYTPRAELAAITSPSGAQYRYTYTPLGDVQSIVDARRHIRSFEYDAKGRLIRERDPIGRGSELTYGSGNRVEVVKSPDGQVTRMAYDLLGRAKETTYQLGPPAQFEYDVVGNLTSEKCGECLATYRYDELDRLVEAAHHPVNKTIRYSYDEAGRRAALEVEGQGRWTYRYDDRDRLVELRDPKKRATSFEYDNAGRVVRQILPNAITTTRNYDGRGRVLGMSTRSATNQLLIDRRYEYNPAGNLVKETREGGVELAYEYDGEDRLISVRGANGPEQFAYDAVGNRLLVGGRAKYDAADQLQRFGEESFTYDDQGRMNLRTSGNRSMEYLYGSGGRITAIKQNDKVVSEYGYDARGRRIWKKFDGRTTHYVYDGSDLLLELNDQLEPVRTWTPGPELDRPISFVRQDQVFYPLTDAIGSVVALADQAGAATARWDYQPFGALRAGADDGRFAKLTPHGFAGGQFDEESGLYCFRARYYDPVLGRFLTRDPLFGQLSNPASLHSYQYAFNNPLRYRDASGAAPEDIANSVDNFSGGIGRTGGSTIVRMGTTGVLNALDWLSPDPSVRTPEVNRAFGEYMGQKIGGPVGDLAGRMATSIVSEPLRFGTGMKAAGAHLDEGNYFRAAGNLGLDVLRAIPIAGAVNGLAKGVQAAAIAASAAPTRVYTAQGNVAEILAQGRIWGQTEGAVYASAHPPSNWLVTTIRNTRHPRTGETPFIFEGEAAKLFTPHPVDGPFSAIKRLGGQMKAGFGDIQITKWSWSDDLKVIVTEAKLLPGQHAGPGLSLPGGFQMTPAQRLAGREAFDNTLNALAGTIGGAGVAVAGANWNNNPPEDEAPNSTAANADPVIANSIKTSSTNTAGRKPPLDPNDTSNWKIPADAMGDYGPTDGNGYIGVPPSQVNWDSLTKRPPREPGLPPELVELLGGPDDDSIELPGDPETLIAVPDHPQSPTGVSGELGGDLIELPNPADETLGEVLVDSPESVLGPPPEPDPNAKWPICPLCGERHDPNE